MKLCEYFFFIQVLAALLLVAHVSAEGEISDTSHAIVVCASTNCKIEPRAADVPVDSLHGAHCCSDVRTEGFEVVKRCGIWVRAADSSGQCLSSLTYHMAKTLCEDQGARLCRNEEYLDNCTTKVRKRKG